MKKHIIPLLCTCALACSCDSCLGKAPDTDKITVACYYFPNYHTGDVRNELAKGRGWSEWELVKSARPRFPGHAQPRVPAWGYGDEKDPLVMARKIDAAAGHGVDVFIFDWYMYEDGPFLNRCLDEGFLGAPNSARLKFALMWANHDWMDIHPHARGAPEKTLYHGKVSPERYDAICDLLVKNYFSRPNYWRVGGKPYFSVYDVRRFVEGFGSMAAAYAGMERLRAKAAAAGLGGVHWNLVAWGRPVLPGENPPKDASALLRALGFDSATSYVWIHHAALPERQTDYNAVRDAYFAHWDKARRNYGVPYIPNVTVGWDSSPRCDPTGGWDGSWGYPFTNTISGNTPARFGEAVRLTRARLLAVPSAPRILTINCWNEWTEGSYLEPDTQNGTAYLEALHDALK